jgi:hypothetical protein
MVNSVLAAPKGLLSSILAQERTRSSSQNNTLASGLKRDGLPRRPFRRDEKDLIFVGAPKANAVGSKIAEQMKSRGARGCGQEAGQETDAETTDDDEVSESEEVDLGNPPPTAWGKWVRTARLHAGASDADVRAWELSLTLADLQAFAEHLLKEGKRGGVVGYISRVKTYVCISRGVNSFTQYNYNTLLTRVRNWLAKKNSLGSQAAPVCAEDVAKLRGRQRDIALLCMYAGLRLSVLETIPIARVRRNGYKLVLTVTGGKRNVQHDTVIDFGKNKFLPFWLKNKSAGKAIDMDEVMAFFNSGIGARRRELKEILKELNTIRGEPGFYTRHSFRRALALMLRTQFEFVPRKQKAAWKEFEMAMCSHQGWKYNERKTSFRHYSTDFVGFKNREFLPVDPVLHLLLKQK